MQKNTDKINALKQAFSPTKIQVGDVEVSMIPLAFVHTPRAIDVVARLVGAIANVSAAEWILDAIMASKEKKDIEVDTAMFDALRDACMRLDTESLRMLILLINDHVDVDLTDESIDIAIGLSLVGPFLKQTLEALGKFKGWGELGKAAGEMLKLSGAGALKGGSTDSSPKGLNLVG